MEEIIAKILTAILISSKHFPSCKLMFLTARAMATTKLPTEINLLLKSTSNPHQEIHFFQKYSQTKDCPPTCKFKMCSVILWRGTKVISPLRNNSRVHSFNLAKRLVLHLKTIINSNLHDSQVNKDMEVVELSSWFKHLLRQMETTTTVFKV